jgi:Meckel syndrome type 1 protein
MNYTLEKGVQGFSLPRRYDVDEGPKLNLLADTPAVSQLKRHLPDVPYAAVPVVVTAAAVLTLATGPNAGSPGKPGQSSNQRPATAVQTTSSPTGSDSPGNGGSGSGSSSNGNTTATAQAKPTTAAARTPAAGSSPAAQPAPASSSAPAAGGMGGGSSPQPAPATQPITDILPAAPLATPSTQPVTSQLPL